MGSGESYVEVRRLVGMGAVPDCGTAARQWVCTHYGDEQDKDGAGVEELQRGLWFRYLSWWFRYLDLSCVGKAEDGGKRGWWLCRKKFVKRLLCLDSWTGGVVAGGWYGEDVVMVGILQRR
ncbi:uncharacterized protein EMH_0028830 [Eimeria mitis]|uniref:Uncharacterized protein n=1 Tax=Eimeria mitis TaxID=44415 RepID=U6JSP5_9EIME|nr:uncharacterized protein EMH_0028830 [Eimeria mitis]CDJ27082.1 hypothetical protein EMH_0028830 [Eimeria mitis]